MSFNLSNIHMLSFWTSYVHDWLSRIAILGNSHPVCEELGMSQSVLYLPKFPVLHGWATICSLKTSPCGGRLFQISKFLPRTRELGLQLRSSLWARDSIPRGKQLQGAVQILSPGNLAMIWTRPLMCAAPVNISFFQQPGNCHHCVPKLWIIKTCHRIDRWWPSREALLYDMM